MHGITRATLKGDLRILLGGCRGYLLEGPRRRVILFGGLCFEWGWDT